MKKPLLLLLFVALATVSFSFTPAPSPVPPTKGISKTLVFPVAPASTKASTSTPAREHPWWRFAMG